MPDLLQRLLEEGVDGGAAPGAALSVVTAGATLCRLSAGWHTYGRQRPLQAADRFDLASLTKVVVTGTLTARLAASGRLDLDVPVSQYLPDYAPGGSPPAFTIRQLLAHAAGLPAGYPFHRLDPATPRALPALLGRVAPIAAPGTTALYSDLGPLLLGCILERLEGKPLDRLAAAAIFAPLGMAASGYNPPVAERPACVPTEYPPGGTYPLQGVVHDENCRWLGGCSGHAGLFAPIGDLEKFARMLLRRGVSAAGEVVIPAAALAEFTRPAGLVPGSTRALAWDTPGPDCSGGNLLPPGSFGHTGFTGTSLWCTPELAVILLTNAVHPHRDNRRHLFFAWRRQLHEAVCRHFGRGSGNGPAL